VVPTASLLPLPDDVTLESAAFLEPLATAVHTLERVKPAPGTTAAIVGRAARVPASAVLQAAGVGPIVMYGQAGDERARAGRVARRRRVSRRSTRDRAHAGPGTGGIGFGLSIESGGTSRAIQTALDIVAGNGRW
jgi:threonine dehydrogenase-like Zn-dependent dehydrogenase